MFTFVFAEKFHKCIQLEKFFLKFNEFLSYVPAKYLKGEPLQFYFYKYERSFLNAIASLDWSMR